jgi:hypothetical protein
LPDKLFIKSVTRSALIVLFVDKPKANNKLSIILDLPEPFGPDTVVKPGNKGIKAFSPKDLKLSSSIDSIYRVILLMNTSY